MYPAASVSGMYFANPEAIYFNVGKVSEDQIKFYAEKKQMDIETVKKLLVMNFDVSL